MEAIRAIDQVAVCAGRLQASGRLPVHNYSTMSHGRAAEALTAALLNWSQSQYWEVNYSELVFLNVTLLPVRSVQVHTADGYTIITLKKGKRKAEHS